jgi:hypothetical protein
MDEVFWVSITTILVGFFGLSMRMCLRSKCDKIECLCIKIHRNTEQENDLPETGNLGSPLPPPSSLSLDNIYRL